VVVALVLIHCGRWSRRAGRGRTGGEVHVNRAQDWGGVAEAGLLARERAAGGGAILAFEVIAAVVGVVPAAPHGIA
jgi:hypothetical protein